MTTEQKKKNRVNFAMRVVGNLLHDNKLFNRTCPSCRGMYSSYETGVCPKCNSALMYITTNDGTNRAMAISEGTLGLCFGPKQEAKDAKSIKNRKNGLTPLYRFKRFSFADDNGVLAMPKDHHRMKSGTQVEITIVNHQVVPAGPFQTTKHGATVEFMLLVFDDQGYGDKVEVLRDSPAVQNNMPVNVDGAGQPLPVDTSDINAMVAAMTLQIEQLKAVVQGTTTAPQPAAQTAATSAEEIVANMDEPPFEESAATASMDVFDGAS